MRALKALCLGLGLLWALPAGAAEALWARLEAAGLAGSDRLRLRAWGDVLEAGQLPRAGFAGFRQALRLQGFDPDQPRGLSRAEMRVAPLLAWDDNINGGVLQERFWLNGLLFEASPDTRARAGLVGGLGLRGDLRFTWGPGRVVALRALTDLAWSPRHRLGRGDGVLQICADNQLYGWSFLDICALGQRALRQRGGQSYHQVSARFGQVLAAGLGLHDAGLALTRAYEEGLPGQNRLALSLESLWPFGVTEFTAQAGAKVAGATVLRRGFGAALSLAPGGHPLRIDLSQQEAWGGRFNNQPRRDRLTSLTLSAPLGARVSARLGLSRNRSTAAIAAWQRVSFELRFTDLLRPAPR